MTRVTCVGITVQDRVYSLPTLPEGDGKYQTDHYLEIGGGPAATTAVIIAKLGVEADFIGRVGDDNCGSTLLTGLEGWGVNTAFCHRYPHARLSQSAIPVDQYGKRIIVNCPSPDLGINAGWLGAINSSRYDPILTDVRQHSGIGKAFSLTRLTGVTMLLDADMIPQDISPLVALANYAMFSTPGLERMIGPQPPEKGLFQTTTQTAGEMYITPSSEGSLWIKDGHLYQREAFSVSMVDTTGTGNVFHGTLAVALAERMPIKEAIRFASAVAAMKCIQPGGRAGIPNREQTGSFLSPYAQNGKHLPRRGKGVFVSIIEVADNPRHDQLVHLIIERDYMSIEELAQLLDVSARTVHRDVQKLSGQDLIIRRYEEVGRTPSVMNTAFGQQGLSLTTGKRATAEAVADYLPERCTIFITIDIIVEAVTRALLDRRNLCIITNSPCMTQILYKNQDIEVMVPEGTSRAHNGGIIGSGAADLIGGFHADYSITSIDTIEHNDTPLKFDVNEALIARMIVKHMWSTLSVADHAKFTTSATVPIGNARDARALFTDALPPNSFYRLLGEENVEPMVAEQEVS